MATPQDPFAALRGQLQQQPQGQAPPPRFQPPQTATQPNLQTADDGARFNALDYDARMKEGAFFGQHGKYSWQMGAQPQAPPVPNTVPAVDTGGGVPGVDRINRPMPVEPLPGIVGSPGERVQGPGLEPTPSAPVPPRPPVPGFDDSRFKDRLAQLTGPSKVQGPDFSGYRQQQEALQARLEALMRGEGINIGDVSADPEARAYRVAKEREAARARQSEADRLGASGMTGSGDFDARVAGIRESTGEAIASQQAGLAGRRRAEAQQGAITAAGLTLTDLDRKFGQERSRFDSELQREQAERARLADALGQEINIERGRYGSENDASERAYREQVDTFERGFREKESAADRDFRERQASRSAESEALDRSFRESEAKYNSARDQYAAEQNRRNAETAAKQQEAALRAQLLQMELGEKARTESVARATPKDELQNILLQQEILKNKKLDPKITYPGLPAVTGATKKPTTITTTARYSPYGGRLG